MKKILVLGGTMFAGRLLVEKLSRMPQFELTLFNRGKSNADLFPGVNQIHGHRESDDIEKVCSQNWDVVVDFSGYYPMSFEKLLASLKGKAGRYIFISTVSVYDLQKFSGRAVLEADEIISCSDAQKISALPDAYGEKKAEMERILLRQDWLDKIIFRPSFIYGKYDWTERFYYWLYRAKFFERLLMPADFNLTLTYVEDLVTGILSAIEVLRPSQVVYNTISQNDVSLRLVVSVAASALNRKVDLVDAPAELLEQKDIHASVFPLFVPFDLNIDGRTWLTDFNVNPVDFASAVSATTKYHEELGWPVPKAGLSVQKEKDVLGV